MRLAALTTAFFLLVATSMLGQDPVDQTSLTSQGILQYDRGETDAAIKTLIRAVNETKSDALAWHFLGLAFGRNGNRDEARKAFAKAIELQTNSFSEMLKSESSDWRDDELLKLRILFARQIESQAKLVEVLTDQDELGKNQLELEKSKILVECLQTHTKQVDGHQSLQKSELEIQRPRIQRKAEPVFPAEAREQKVDAYVALRAVFAPDGTVKYTEVVRSSGDVFTRAAIEAALKTKFEPATLCGKPVAFTIQLEYSFKSIF